MPIEIIRPESDHNVELTPAMAGSNWQMVTNASDSYNVWNSPADGSTRTDWYGVSDPSFQSATIINSVKVYYRVLTETSHTAHFIPFVYVDSTNWGTGTDHSGDWTTYSETIGRPGGGPWTYTDILNLYTGISIVMDGINYIAACSYLYVEVDYTQVGGILFQTYRKKITLGGPSIY